MKLDPEGCALSGYLVACSGPLTHEHIVARGRGRGNSAVKSYLDNEINIAHTCYQHNVGRYADTPEARRILLVQAIYKYGLSRVREFYSAIPWKVPTLEYKLEGMLDLVREPKTG